MINYVYQLVAPGAFSIKYEDVRFEDNVIVRPKYLAICHADQRYYMGKREQRILEQKLPMALVHECCGEIVYDPTESYKIGQSVALIPNQPGKYDQYVWENYRKDAKFLSSGEDGFLKEYVSLPVDRIVDCEGMSEQIAAITEFVSVAVQAVRRFLCVSHERREKIGIWGDGSLAFVLANIIRVFMPESCIYVVGKNRNKLSYFSFVEGTFFTGRIPEEIRVDHAFECCGGEGSYYAIEEIIQRIKPQGTVVLMGVSENKVPINTRDILEKGLNVLGSSRSGREDFEKAVECMKNPQFQKRLKLILEDGGTVRCIQDIHKVFQKDINTLFKTVFRWEI